MYPASATSRKLDIITGSKFIPWLCGPTKYMAAAWFRALSSSSGFKLTEFSKSRDRPAFSTIARCALSIFSKSSSSFSLSSSEFHGWASVCVAPWKPWITARSPSPRPSIVSASTTDLFIVISLSTASFCTTFSKSSVSFPKALPPRCCWSLSSSESFSSPASASSLTATAISVTDWKIVEAILRTWSNNFSKGRSTIAETELDSTREKPTMSSMTITRRIMFINESS
mmetsp:Transcript_90879/g.261884  ORF Transcript_90879/g.261884 Transcript_90879/m.261884 type:complete len:228 (-) Transcript_90879:1366-2049(-)